MFPLTPSPEASPDAIREFISVTYGIHNQGNNDKFNGYGIVEITKLKAHPLDDITLYYKLIFDEEKGLSPTDVHLSSDETEIIMFSASSDGFYYVSRFCIDESTKCERAYEDDYIMT